MRHAFTLIEMLVVITVLAVLSSLVLVTTNVLRARALGSKTSMIIQVTVQAIDLQRANRGGRYAPAEHPLAGSFADATRPRAAFVRADGTAIAIPVGTLPLRGVPITGVAAGHQARVLADDDRFADPDLPLLYGVERQRLGVLGEARVYATGYKRLTVPRDGAAIADPDNAQIGTVVMGTAAAAGVTASLEYLLGATPAAKELARAEALFAPPDDTQLIAHDRVWGSAEDRRQPERSSRIRIAGSWQPYRLRGLAVYDGWNRELLISERPGGGLQVESAGRDGAFGWAAGPDGSLQTAAHATGPAGDDRDGSIDNLRYVDEP